MSDGNNDPRPEVVVITVPVVQAPFRIVRTDVDPAGGPFTLRCTRCGGDPGTCPCGERR